MPSEAAAPPGATGDVLDALSDTRSRTLALVAHLDDDALERVYSPLMSPLVWDLGHIAAFEDLWLAHRGAGLPLLRPDLAEVYDAFETPRAQRGDLPYLRRGDALAYLAAVRERVLELAADPDPTRPDAALHELVVRHEQQHTETMLQTMQLAHLPAPPNAYAPTFRAPVDGTLAGLTGLELVEVPAGPCTIGAPAEGFAYDNERPRHGVDLPAFRIGRTAVTNGAFQAFVEGGGYARPEWWTREAWAWKEQYDIERPAGWTDAGPPTHEWRMDRCEPLDPSKPVVHVSWFEADAFARAHDARLPTETEWEKAATWDQQTGTALSQPWGDCSGDAIAMHANVDQRAFGTVAVGTHPGGTSPAGCLGMIGDTWEWTAGGFDGYPGFAAYPYREYSEVFFGGDYHVLRGGSWATRSRVATPTFRNWDHPQRRQIFAGLRIAKDA